MSGDLLTHEEIVALTGKQRHRAQARALVHMGIRHAVRPDGAPVVARALVAAILGRYSESAPPAEPQVNLAALHAVRRRPKP